MLLCVSASLKKLSHFHIPWLFCIAIFSKQFSRCYILLGISSFFFRANLVITILLDYFLGCLFESIKPLPYLFAFLYCRVFEITQSLPYPLDILLGNNSIKTAIFFDYFDLICFKHNSLPFYFVILYCFIFETIQSFRYSLVILCCRIFKRIQLWSYSLIISYCCVSKTIEWLA